MNQRRTVEDQIGIDFHKNYAQCILYTINIDVIIVKTNKFLYSKEV